MTEEDRSVPWRRGDRCQCSEQPVEARDPERSENQSQCEQRDGDDSNDTRQVRRQPGKRRERNGDPCHEGRIEEVEAVRELRTVSPDRRQWVDLERSPSDNAFRCPFELHPITPSLRHRVRCTENADEPAGLEKDRKRCEPGDDREPDYSGQAAFRHRAHLRGGRNLRNRDIGRERSWIPSDRARRQEGLPGSGLPSTSVQQPSGRTLSCRIRPFSTTLSSRRGPARS